MTGFWMSWRSLQFEKQAFCEFWRPWKMELCISGCAVVLCISNLPDFLAELVLKDTRGWTLRFVGLWFIDGKRTHGISWDEMGGNTAKRTWSPWTRHHLLFAQTSNITEQPVPFLIQNAACFQHTGAQPSDVVIAADLAAESGTCFCHSLSQQA